VEVDEAIDKIPLLGSGSLHPTYGLWFLEVEVDEAIDKILLLGSGSLHPTYGLRTLALRTLALRTLAPPLFKGGGGGIESAADSYSSSYSEKGPSVFGPLVPSRARYWANGQVGVQIGLVCLKMALGMMNGGDRINSHLVFLQSLSV